MTAMPKPTHYTKALDADTGSPFAVRMDTCPADEIAGSLPDNWDAAFFDWQPRHDPKGKWVEMEGARRAALWNDVKVDRETEIAANVTVKIGTRNLAFQADDKSLAALQFEAEVARSDPLWPGADWTTAGNATVRLDRIGLNAVITAIGAHRRAVRAQSDAARARIENTAEPLLRSLAEVKAAILR